MSICFYQNFNLKHRFATAWFPYSIREISFWPNIDEKPHVFRLFIGLFKMEHILNVECLRCIIGDWKSCHTRKKICQFFLNDVFNFYSFDYVWNSCLNPNPKPKPNVSAKKACEKHWFRIENRSPTRFVVLFIKSIVMWMHVVCFVDVWRKENGE